MIIIMRDEMDSQVLLQVTEQVSITVAKGGGREFQRTRDTAVSTQLLRLKAIDLMGY